MTPFDNASKCFDVCVSRAVVVALVAEAGVSAAAVGVSAVGDLEEAAPGVAATVEVVEAEGMEDADVVAELRSADSTGHQVVKRQRGLATAFQRRMPVARM